MTTSDERRAAGPRTAQRSQLLAFAFYAIAVATLAGIGAVSLAAALDDYARLRGLEDRPPAAARPSRAAPDSRRRVGARRVAGREGDRRRRRRSSAAGGGGGARGRREGAFVARRSAGCDRRQRRAFLCRRNRARRGEPSAAALQSRSGNAVSRNCRTVDPAVARDRGRGSPAHFAVGRRILAVRAVKSASAAVLSLCLAALTASPTRAGSIANSDNPVAAIPLASLTATRERPLFSPSRRPPPVAAEAPTVEAPAPQSSPRPEPSLLGTVIGPSDCVAVVVAAGEPPASLHVGETAGGWTLRSIDPRSATFEGSGGMVTLELPNALPSLAEVPPTAPATSVRDERSCLKASQ